MVKLLLVLLSVFLILLPLSHTQFYNSLAVMEILLETQHRLIQHIESYVRYITDGRKALVVQKFLSRCKKEDQLARWNRAHYLGNPINAFTLILRLTRDMDYIEKILNETTAGMKYKPNNTLPYPDADDVEGVVQGITRLQLLYDLDVSRMANGTLTTTFSAKKPALIENVTPMTTCDCYELGLVEYDEADRSRNIVWIMEALRRFEYNADCPINKADLYDRLSGDYFFMGDYAKAIHWIEKRIDASPGDPRNAKYKQSIGQIAEISRTTKSLPYQKKPKNRDYVTFPTMCLKPYYSPNASLTCYYAHGPHPFLLLASMKAERLHLSPPILMFYDVITDDEILAIKTLAIPRFHKATAAAKEGTYNFNICIHQVAWLQDEWSPATLRVRRRMAQFSGLQLDNSTDDFQVANYGTGGYYGAHYDFIRTNTTDTGKTLATALVYLADVEEGGATVFTKLGLTVFPVRKAAMFWWDLDPTGHGDYDMLHAVCPMLRGSRWGSALQVDFLGWSRAHQTLPSFVCSGYQGCRIHGPSLSPA